MSELVQRKCVPCSGEVPALDLAGAIRLKAQLSDHWSLSPDAKRISAHFDFRNYWQTTAFVNAVAWIAHQEDHHPEIAFGYRHAMVTYWTHAADGLTENDFICAAKIDALLK